MIVPSLMCFAWAGGTAVNLKLNDDANGVILDAANGDKIFVITTFMLVPISQLLSWGMAVMILVLLKTFLVTSADSRVLIVNTINAAGDECPKARPHILFWGGALALVVGGLLISGGTSVIQTAINRCLAVLFGMVLMCTASIKAIDNDGRLEAVGVPTTHSEITGVTPA